MMRSSRYDSESDGLGNVDSSRTKVLSAQEERQVLRELADCKEKLSEALAQIPTAKVPEDSDPQTLAQYVAAFYSGDAPSEARLGVIFRRYSEVRSQLALANMRLIAHVAKRFRDRGIAYSDLLQEGFCGLLEAIDRFDLGHETKLATYATWWIRQSMQRAVASGAYPVRLSPRHLRQLAQNQEEVERVEAGQSTLGATEPLHGASTEMIHRIHTATRPTISLDAGYQSTDGFSMLQTMSHPESNQTDQVDMDEAVGKLLENLRPREQEVLALRFGLGGQERLSLSQVGKVLQVSKERIRQIQDRALEKLRIAVVEHHVEDLLMVGG